MDSTRIANRMLKLTVVFLCLVNTAMWGLYTESPFMAFLWAATAIGFVFWIRDDTRRD